MIDYLATELLNAFKKGADDARFAILSGNITSYEEYKYFLGCLQGLEQACEIAKEILIRKLEEEDQDG